MYIIIIIIIIIIILCIDIKTNFNIESNYNEREKHYLTFPKERTICKRNDSDGIRLERGPEAIDPLRFPDSGFASDLGLGLWFFRSFFLVVWAVV